jgi:uncharacterized phosphosugar-binding protein
MLQIYFQKIKELMNIVEAQEYEKLNKAARKVAQCIQNSGIVHLFGCGHSHMLAEEVFYRAGGLAPINPILFDDLMLHKGALRSSQLEKQNGFAEQIMTNVTITPKDIVIVTSTSGRNPVPIDVAQIAKKQGAFVIAITSLVYAASQPSRHTSGKYLFESVDLVIDNHIEVGDALLSINEPFKLSFGSGSTVIGMAIINGVMAEAIEMMATNDFEPPVLKSGNVDGGAEYNQQIIDKYKGRIPLLDPEV